MTSTPKSAKLLLAISLLLAVAAHAAESKASSNEVRTERYYQSIREDPNQLQAFLRRMPKGGDLHNHLLGAIYAETFIGWAAEKGLCVDPNSFRLTEPAPCPPAMR